MRAAVALVFGTNVKLAHCILGLGEFAPLVHNAEH